MSITYSFPGFTQLALSDCNSFSCSLGLHCINLGNELQNPERKSCVDRGKELQSKGMSCVNLEKELWSEGTSCLTREKLS